MAQYQLSPDYLFMKKSGKITVTSVDPADNTYFEIEDTAAEMFQLIIEKEKSLSETISIVAAEHSSVDVSVIEADAKSLVQFLLDKKVISQKEA